MFAAGDYSQGFGVFNVPLEGFIAPVLVITSICHDSSSVKSGVIRAAWVGGFCEQGLCGRSDLPCSGPLAFLFTVCCFKLSSVPKKFKKGCKKSASLHLPVYCVSLTSRLDVLSLKKGKKGALCVQPGSGAACKAGAAPTLPARVPPACQAGP